MIQNDLEELKQLYYDFKKVQDDCELRLIDKKIYNYENLYFLCADFRPLIRSIDGDPKYSIFIIFSTVALLKHVKHSLPKT